MRPMTWGFRVAAGAIALALTACASVTPVRTDASDESFTIDRQTLISRLAQPEALDWTHGRITTAKADELRKELAQAAPAAAQRRVQAVANLWDQSSVNFPTSASTGVISSAPAYHFMTGHAYWLTNSGWLLKRNMITNATGAIKVHATQTFPKTAITMSPNGKRIYLTSLEGTFFVIDALNLSVISSVALSGNDGAVVPSAIAPYIDPLASRVDGIYDVVYALTHTGKLYKFEVRTPKATGVTTVTQVGTYDLPRDTTATGTAQEYFQGWPVVIRGKVVVGSWYRQNDRTKSAFDTGYLHYFDTTANTSTLKVGLSSPVWAPPAVEFDDNLNPVLAFVPTGYLASMVSLATGERAESAGLIVNKETPVNGTLFGYAYGTGGVTVVEKAAYAGSGVSIADDTALTLPLSGSWIDKSRFYAAKVYDGDVSTPIWAYTKFYVDNTDTIVSGSQRAIIDANLELKCNSSSNASANSNPDPLRAFRVSPYLAGTTTLWNDANITPANRPTFEDGTAFQLTALNSHTEVELSPNAGNVFKNGQNYRWSGKGRVTAAGQFYSFGFAHPELPYVNQASNNGQPFKTSTPRFDGGTNPRLFLTLSGEGFATPTMENPIAIDSANKRIFVVNTNALYTVSYQSPTYDASATPFDSFSFGERKSNFGDPAQTFFALTRLGQDVDGLNAGPLTTVPSDQYVQNLTAPLFTGTSVYVQDNHPGARRTAINRFTPGTAPTATGGGSAPTLAESLLLTNAAGDAHQGATYMSYDYVGSKLYVGTADSASGATKGRAWVISQ